MQDIDGREILTLKSKAKLNCTLCEKCCEYRGDIKLTPINVIEISKFLNISIKEFIEKYTEPAWGDEPEIVIKGIGEKKECIFNNRENYKCEIQKVKPMQCTMFPLVPYNITQDLFINSEACPVNKDKITKVDKWLNGNNNIYKNHKYLYLNWIDLMNQIQPIWNIVKEENKDKIYNLLYHDYDIKNKKYEYQIMTNMKKVRDIVFEDYNLILNRGVNNG